jgi:hypothetical protein
MEPGPSLFVTVCAAGLLAIGLWHIVNGPATERVFSKVPNVRAVGALRLFFAERSVRLQKSAYPRWVHGCLISVASVAMWWLYRRYAA